MIANNPQPPTFANTIEAMEKGGRTLDRVQALFGVMTDNMSTPAYQALDKEWSQIFGCLRQDQSEREAVRPHLEPLRPA